MHNYPKHIITILFLVFIFNVKLSLSQSDTLKSQFPELYLKEISNCFPDTIGQFESNKFGEIIIVSTPYALDSIGEFELNGKTFFFDNPPYFQLRIPGSASLTGGKRKYKKNKGRNLYHIYHNWNGTVLQINIYKYQLTGDKNLDQNALRGNGTSTDSTKLLHSAHYVADANQSIWERL